ncbi:twin-arginine translocation signal domain-containing protein [Halogeometricum borinquense]|uniref:Twin-arginine translocation signal domain-containing protein n=1 Tax=Halogeometricum borinquense TaxID=60847 RepID=A0A482T4K1_9EURY|nr:twin-arginine translocation signal domain-containing protein [Halogeometricum borinquense]RYJ07717.1 twin-arginine translocation signal domain-containing protein [Halogeometricum borinquense]
MQDQSRRQFLKKASIATVGAATVGSVMTGPALAYNKDFRDEVGNLLSEGKVEKAKKKLNDEGIDFSVTEYNTLYSGDAEVVNDEGEIVADDEDEFNPEDFSGSDSGNSTADEGNGITPDTYKPPGDDSNTNCALLVSNVGGDEYDVFYSWSMDKRSFADDTTNAYNGCGADGAGIFWPTEYFNTPSTGRDNFYDYDSDRISYDQWEPRGGISAKVDDPNRNVDAPDTYSDAFSTHVIAAKDGADTQNFIGQYEHTWVGALTPCVGVSVSISLGPLSLSTSGTPYTWKMPASETLP